MSGVLIDSLISEKWFFMTLTRTHAVRLSVWTHTVQTSCPLVNIVVGNKNIWFDWCWFGHKQSFKCTSIVSFSNKMTRISYLTVYVLKNSLFFIGLKEYWLNNILVIGVQNVSTNQFPQILVKFAMEWDLIKQYTMK